MSEPLLIIGILFVVAGLVGGGVKLAGNEIPVLNTVGRQVGVMVIGLVVLGYAWFTRADFRVVSATVSADQSVVTICPATVSYTGTIEVAGGSGQVEYRFYHDGQPSSIHSVEVAEPGTKTVQESFFVNAPIPGLPRLGPDDAYLEILSPNVLRSAPASTQIFC
jgi:hypothetical protein